MNVRKFVTAAVIVTASFGVSIAAMSQAAKAPAKAPAKGAAGRVIEITVDDTMKFSVTNIDAKPGEQLTIKLTNNGKMPKAAAAHNVVVLKTGTDVMAFGGEAVMAGATDYIPEKFKAQVVANTKTTGPGESVEVSFKAPAAGVYPYICSFPGHYVTMKGTLTVK